MADEIEIQRIIEEIPEEERPVSSFIGLVDRYEFTQEQNGQIKQLSDAMGMVGTIQTTLGGLQVIGGVISLFVNWFGALQLIVMGLVLVFTGMWLRQSSTSLDVVVQSRGSDIFNLMEALENLTKVYRLQRAWYLLAIVVAVGAIAYGLFQVFGRPT